MTMNIFEGINFEDYRDDDGCIDLPKIWLDVGGPEQCAGINYLDLLTAINKVKSRQVAAMALTSASFFEALAKDD